MMNNRLQAIRAAIFGITFSIFYLLFVVYSVMYGYFSTTTLIVSAVMLAMLTLCVSWARLKPSLIYGGLHTFIWLIGIAMYEAFDNTLPLFACVLVSIFLLLRVSLILQILHNLGVPTFAGPIPKQAPSEPMTPFASESGYQAGYTPAGPASARGEPAMPYQSQYDAQSRTQAQYPEMRQ